MLQNAYSLAKIGADTAENERNLPKIGNYPTGPGLGPGAGGAGPPALGRAADRDAIAHAARRGPRALVRG